MLQHLNSSPLPCPTFGLFASSLCTYHAHPLCSMYPVFAPFMPSLCTLYVQAFCHLHLFCHPKVVPTLYTHPYALCVHPLHASHSVFASFTHLCASYSSHPLLPLHSLWRLGTNAGSKGLVQKGEGLRCHHHLWHEGNKEVKSLSIPTISDMEGHEGLWTDKGAWKIPKGTRTNFFSLHNHWVHKVQTSYITACWVGGVPTNCKYIEPPSHLHSQNGK